MISAFGVDHGDISKSKWPYWVKAGKASPVGKEGRAARREIKWDERSKMSSASGRGFNFNGHKKGRLIVQANTSSKKSDPPGLMGDDITRRRRKS